jgi:hypothetical protein
MGPYRTLAEPPAVRHHADKPDREEDVVHGVMAASGLIGVATTAAAANFGGGFVVAVALLVLGLHGVLHVGGR